MILSYINSMSIIVFDAEYYLKNKFKFKKLYVVRELQKLILFRYYFSTDKRLIVVFSIIQNVINIRFSK